MRVWFGVFVAAFILTMLILTAATTARAEDWVVEKLDEAPPEEVSLDIAARLNVTGLKVKSSATRTACDIWLVKEAPGRAGFQPTSSTLYPYEVGQLLGVIRFKRRTNDFRGQELASGVYVLRFALQPEDGNHVGTSDTRDFIVLLRPADDMQPDNMPQEDLFRLSAAAAETPHPAMLSLTHPSDTTGELSVAHDESRDWRVLHVALNTKTGDKAAELPISLIVSGHAVE